MADIASPVTNGTELAVGSIVQVKMQIACIRTVLREHLSDAVFAQAFEDLKSGLRVLKVEYNWYDTVITPSSEIYLRVAVEKAQFGSALIAKCIEAQKIIAIKANCQERGDVAVDLLLKGQTQMEDTIEDVTGQVKAFTFGGVGAIALVAVAALGFIVWKGSK